MTSPRKPGFVLPVAIVLAVLLALYVGAYYATVEGVPDIPAGVDPVSLDPTGTFRHWPSKPRYRIRWVLLPPDVFTPMHSLDRRVRPHIWEPEHPPDPRIPRV